MLQRLQQGLPRGWFGDDPPVVQALQSGTAWAQTTVYNQITYAALQTRIKTATALFLDIISADFFGTALPRLTNETDAAFRSRILANLFVKGPTRANMSNVLTLLTGKAPTIFEPSNATDSGGWSAGGMYWGATGAWGSPRPYQAFVTVYRPDQSMVSIGEWNTWRLAWGAYGGWSSATPNAITDATLIAAVESTRPLGTVMWMRIANAPVLP